MAAAKVERRPSVKWLFSQLDRGNKGRLTVEDIERFTGDREKAKEAFLLLDTDGDGVVSAKDFETGFVKYVRNHGHNRADSGVEGEGQRSRYPSVGEAQADNEEHYEYDPASEKDLPPPELSSSMDEFEDGKLKLLHIWRKIGETRPELKDDFERLVTDIGQQLAGAKDSVRKYRAEADRRVRELDEDFEQAIQETETRVRSKTFHSLRAKESQYKKQLQKKSWEMETMRQHMQQLESEAHTRRALKQKVNELEQDKRLLEDRLYVESHPESSLPEPGMGTGRDSQQQQNARIPTANLPPGVEAAIGQGITKFRGDFKYSRSHWNRTVVSPSAKCRGRLSRSPDGASGDDSSREGTPVEDSQERRGSFSQARLGDGMKSWAREVRRKSSPDPAEISKLLRSMHGEDTKIVSDKKPVQRTNTVSSETSQTYPEPCHTRKESSPIIQIEGEVDGNPSSGRGSTLSHSTPDDIKRLSMEVSDDSYASPGGSPASSRRSTLEKRRGDASPHLRRDHSPHRSCNWKQMKGVGSPAPPRSPGRGSHDVSSVSQPVAGTGRLSYSVSPRKKPVRAEAYPQVQFIHTLSQTPDLTFKLLIIGNSGVGKSSFLIRLTENTFSSNYSLTVGVDFKSVHAKVEDKIVSMRIWDTAGQERFKAVTKSYYHDCDGVILMYDVTQEHTFLAVREWIDSIKETIGIVPPSLLLLGNKLDCVHTASDRGVSFEAGETMAKIFGAKFMEVSAKTGQNVADAFYAVARQMVEDHDSEGGKKVDVRNVSLKQAEPTKSSCCSRS